MVERISTGIAGFDKLVDGGLPKSSITLVSGTPGTGKSILCAQVIYNNALKGKKCLYLNLEQNEGRLESQMKQFGWDPEKIRKNLKITSVDSSNPNMVEYILEAIGGLNYDLIVLDSLDSISSLPISLEDMGKSGAEKASEFIMPAIFAEPLVGRAKLKRIFTAIAKSKATALLTSERIEGAQGISRDTISEFLCDGIITMHYVEIGIADYRTMLIIKVRNSDHYKDVIPFNITGKGIEILVDELRKKK